MNRSDIPTSNDPDVVASAKALQRSAKRALEIGIKTKTPVYVMEKGDIIDLAKKSPKRSKRGNQPKGKAN